jgi:hypothetical protein
MLGFASLTTNIHLSHRNLEVLTQKLKWFTGSQPAIIKITLISIQQVKKLFYSFTKVVDLD